METWTASFRAIHPSKVRLCFSSPGDKEWATSGPLHCIGIKFFLLLWLWDVIMSWWAFLWCGGFFYCASRPPLNVLCPSGPAIGLIRCPVAKRWRVVRKVERSTKKAIHLRGGAYQPPALNWDWELTNGAGWGCQAGVAQFKTAWAPANQLCIKFPFADKKRTIATHPIGAKESCHFQLRPHLSYPSLCLPPTIHLLLIFRKRFRCSSLYFNFHTFYMRLILLRDILK